MFGTIDFLRHNFSLNLLSDIVLIIVLHTEANNIAVDVFLCWYWCNVDVDGNVAINVGKYLETNCWKWEASIARAQPPTVLSDFLHCCHWPESLLIKIEKFKRKRCTIIKLCLSLFVIVVIFVFTVFFTFAFYLILPQKWGLHIIMSSRQHWIIKVGALKITDPLYIGQSIVTRYLVL